MDTRLLPFPAASPWRRSAGFAVGIATHLLFAVTVWRLFAFLSRPTGPTSAWAIGIDAALTLQFAVLHSLLLAPPVKKFLSPWISRSFYGCFYCVATCLCLLLTFWQWRTFGPTLWSLDGISARVVQAGFLGSWGALLYSLSLTGLGYQTGLTEWLHWVRRQPLPRREFHPRGVYRCLRHPVYLSFLGLLWFAPTMTADHALLTGVWTIYIFLGSWLKDLRLAFYLGDGYRHYAERVPGYPFVPLGPLARLRRSATDAEPAPLRRAA
jgi:methanethiol S-methyltransferase